MKLDFKMQTKNIYLANCLEKNLTMDTFVLQLHVCEMILEHEGVMGYVTIHELQMDLVPLDRDILSLELPLFFRSFYLVCYLVFLSIWYTYIKYM